MRRGWGLRGELLLRKKRTCQHACCSSAQARWRNLSVDDEWGEFMQPPEGEWVWRWRCAICAKDHPTRACPMPDIIEMGHAADAASEKLAEKIEEAQRNNS